MSSKVSLLRALRRQKKEGERKARGERRRRRRPIVVARTSSLRRFFRRHGVVHVPYVTCFCEDTWRKKKSSFFGLQTVKSPKLLSTLLPKSVRVSPRRERGAQRTLDQRRPLRESPKYRPTERSSRSIIRSQKKRKKKKRKGTTQKRKTLEFYS